AAVLRLDRTAAVSGRTSRTLRMGNLAPGIGPFPPVEKGPTSLGFADHPTAPFTLLPRNSQPLLGIVRNGCSGSVGTTARDQSVRVLGINWNSCSGSLGAPNPLLSIARVALFLLARSVPVNDESLPQMMGTHSAFDNVEGFFVPVRALAQDLLPAHIASKHGLAKGCHFGTVLGNNGDKEPTFAVDRAQVLLCTQLAVCDVNE